MPDAPVFQLNPSLEVDRLAARFARDGRLQIVDFLVAGEVERLAEELEASRQWMHVISGGREVYEIAREDFDAMDAEKRSALNDAICAEATHGFRFRFDAIRVPGNVAGRPSSSGLLCAFANFMSHQSTLEVIAQIAGDCSLDFADAQATRYRAGDFLTRHDDDVAGKNRRLAYVMGLTKAWLPEWGGLLLFNGNELTITEAMVPRFNALCLFRVPQPHSVSAIAPYADCARLSITGWLRSGPQP